MQPKQDTEKPTRVTQGHGSLHGSEIIKRVKEIKQKKLEAEEKEEEKKTQQRNMVEKFIKCKNGCTCEEVSCKAAGLKQCSICHNVLKSNWQQI